MPKRGQHDGSIRKRPDGSWEARIRLSGKQRSFYGPTRAECVAKMEAAKGTVKSGGSLDHQRRHLDGFIEEWLVSIEPTVKASTLDGYTTIARRHILPHLGRFELGKLAARDIDHLYATLAKKGLSRTTIRHIHAVLHKALHFAVLRGYLVRNVAELANAPKPRHFETMPLDQEQSRRFLRAARGDRLYALYALVITTGMRRGELLGLMWQDLRPEQATIRVCRSLRDLRGKLIISDVKTVASRRTIQLQPQVIEALRDHRLRQDEDRRTNPQFLETGLIFTTEIGTAINPANLYSRSFKPVRQAAGLPVTFRIHDLRHTAATWMISNGVPLKAVQTVLGHSSPTVTLAIYSHVTPPMMDAATKALGALLPSPAVSQRNEAPATEAAASLDAA